MQPRFPFSRGVRRNLTVPLAARRSLWAVALALLLVCGLQCTSAAQIGLGKALLGGNPPKKDTKTSGTPNPEPAAAQPAETPPPSVIPLPDLALRSQQLSQSLRDIAATLPTPEQLSDVSDAVTERQAVIADKQKEVDALLAGTPTTVELREQENYWRELLTQNLAWRKQLLDWANAAQSAVNQLDIQEPQWKATLEANKDLPALGPAAQLIKDNVNTIHKIRTQTNNVLQQVVKMQIDNSAGEQAATDTLNRLVQARIAFQGKLFQRDSLPIWQLALRRQVGEAPPLFKSASGRWIAIKTFAAQSRGILIFLVILLVISLWVSYHLSRITRHTVPVDEEQAAVLRILRHWISLGLLPALVLGYVLTPSAPLTFLGVAVLASFVPVLRLLPPLIEPRFRVMLYVMGAAYAFNVAVNWLSLSPVWTRELLFLSNGTVFLLFVWLLRPSRMSFPEKGRRYVVLALRIAVAILGLGLLSNALGYVKLAQFLSIGCICSTFIAVGAVAGVRIFTLLLAEGVNHPQAERLAIIRLHRQAIVRWVPRLMQWGAFLLWLSSTLDLFSVRDAVKGAITGFLNFPIAGSASGVTLSGVFGFFFTLVGGYLLASGVRFLLREEVLGRFHLARGVPELIASTVYYLLLLLIFLGAVNAGGVELNKFTVLTGALGVGVGFGLQNIVNNFVSGLILQFERPIHLQDVLEVDGQTGKVTRIGIRSSTLTTFQGAEVIIPNANLISGKVTNWTLTEAKRRGELPVGVAYGTDADVVINLLLKAANAHETVLTNPPPAAYFVGFGDSSLNYELQFWVMQDSNWIKVRSEIALVVMKSFEEAGIEIPFPQRDLHVRSIASSADTLDPLGAEAAAGGNGLEDENEERDLRTNRRSVAD